MNMALPKALQREAAEAQELQARLTQEVEATPAAVNDPAQLPPDPPPVSAPPQPATEPASAPAPAQSADYWEQRFKTVTGMVQSEVPQLRAQLKTMGDTLAALKQELDASRKAAAAAPAAPVKPVVDQKDVEAFGADLMDMVQRQTQRAIDALHNMVLTKANELEGRVSALETQVNGVSQKTESTLEQQFYATLSQLVPDWEQVNVDERWLTWLAAKDPVYGVPRQAALEAALQRFDAQQVANVFKAFKASLPAPKQPESLANQVAPSGAASVAPAPVQPKPILSSKFVLDFGNDVARGRYRGREQEAARLTALIDEAAAEGRIR